MNTTLVLGLMMTGMNVGEPPPPSPLNFAYPCCQGHTPAGHFRRTDLISPYNVIQYTKSSESLKHLHESVPIIRYNPQTFGFRFEGWRDRDSSSIGSTTGVPEGGPPLVQTGALSPVIEDNPPPKMEPTPVATVEKSVKLLGARSHVEQTSPIRATAPITAVVMQAPSVPAPEAPSFASPFADFESTPPMPALAAPTPEPQDVEVVTVTPVPETEEVDEDVWQVVYDTDPNTGEAVARIVTPSEEPVPANTAVASSSTPPQPWKAPESEQGPVFRMSGAPLWLDSIP